MRKEDGCAAQLWAELTAGSQTLRKYGFLRFLSRLFSITAPHAGSSSQNLKSSRISKTDSFDFAKWDGGGLGFCCCPGCL